MSSSDVKAGKELVNKWAAIPAEIQISFRVDGIAGATFTGTIDALADDRLSLAGGKGNAFLDLSYVEDARDVLTDEGLRRSGLSPESYGECVTFSLPLGVKVTLVALPRLRPSARPD
jgi:hypothetical protein